MRIKKLGGGGMPAFVSFTNTNQALPSIAVSAKLSATETTLTTEDKELIDKLTLKFLYEKGLPSDILKLLSESEVFNRALQNSDNPYIRNNLYKQLLSFLPEIRLNKEEYDEAIKHAREKGTLQEFAVASDGSVYVTDEDGKLVLRDPFKLQEGDHMVTNGYLAQMRAYSTNTAFDKGSLTNTIASSISLSEIVKVINDTAKNVGTQTVVNESFVKKDGQLAKIKKGLDKLLEEAEPGVYKLSEKKITHDATIDAAINYLLAQLTPQQMGVLKVNAAKLGLDNKSGVKQFVTLALRSQLSETLELKLDYDALLSKVHNSSSIGSNIGEIDSTPASRFFAGLGEVKPYEFRIADTTSTYIAYGNSTFISKNGSPMGQRMLLSDLSTSDLNGGIDLTLVSFGGIPVQMTDTNKIIINGDKVVAVELPYTEIDGRIVPEFDAMNTISQILKDNENLIKSGKFEEVNKIFVSKGLKPYFSANGTSSGFYKRFAVIQAYADESIVNHNSNIYNIIGEYSDVDDYELGEIVLSLKDYNKKNGTKYVPSKPTFLGIGIPFTSENIVKSMIFVPISSNATSWFLGKMKSSEAQQLDAASLLRQMLLDAIQNYKPTKNPY